jgi:hypothetical protein
LTSSGHHLGLSAIAYRRAPFQVFARWLAGKLAIPPDPTLA